MDTPNGPFLQGAPAVIPPVGGVLSRAILRVRDAATD